MSRRSLLWHLFPSYLAITVLSLLAAALVAAHVARESHVAATLSDLAARTALVRERVAPLVSAPGTPAAPREMLSAGPDSAVSVDRICKRLGNAASTRITVIHSSGAVLGDSDADPSRTEPHLPAGRPEIAAAFDGRPGSAVRYSRTLRRSMAYFALPITVREDGRQKVVAVVRTGIPLDPLRSALRAELLSSNRYLERIADSATNIAEDVIYLVEGRIVRHGAGREDVPEDEHPA